MNKCKKKYYLNNPNDVMELLDLLENGDDSDIGEIEGEQDSDEDEIEVFETPRTGRLGADKVTQNDMKQIEAIQRRNIQDNEEQQREEEESDEEFSSDNAEVPAVLASQTNEKKNNVKWDKISFECVDINFLLDENHNTSQPTLFPLDYFLRYVPETMFEEMAMYTNMYAIQNSQKNFRHTSKNEMQTLIALHIMIGCLNKFPRIRMYWERSLRINAFLDNMSRDRFFQLRTCLHFVNNLEKPPDITDKLFKVRPLIESIRKRCLELDLERDLCIDEQMIPFTGTMSIKQYIKGKPCPWGIKVFVLCGKSGQAYDFLFYQGKSTELDEATLKKFGVGSSVVLHLAKRISKEGHHLFFDNYFSSYSLLTHLKEKKILAAGTIRLNRFAKPPVMSDKEMKKEERGFADQVVSEDGIVVVKWLDNRTVCLASNYVGKGVEDKAKRWDKKRSQYIEINRPEIVKEYNHSMGGVDLLDQLISLYRIFIRSRKWTLRVSMHMIDFALVNSWLEYKKDCRRNNIQNKNILDLLDFRMRVAESLIKFGKTVVPNKRGRPSSVSFSPPASPVLIRGPRERRPLEEIQTDAVDHMPHFDNKKEATRCKKLGCHGRSHIFCDKCNVHLCLVKNRNCFTEFHRNRR